VIWVLVHTPSLKPFKFEHFNQVVSLFTYGRIATVRLLFFYLGLIFHFLVPLFKFFRQHTLLLRNLTCSIIITSSSIVPILPQLTLYLLLFLLNVSLLVFFSHLLLEFL
jgi:hypothetical protein